MIIVIPRFCWVPLVDKTWETFDDFDDTWPTLELNSNQKTVTDFLFSQGVVYLLAQIF